MSVSLTPTLSLPRRQASEGELLFIHKLLVEYLLGLKGQNNLAQGIVSGGTIRNVALSKEYTTKSVRPACRRRGEHGING